MWRLWAEDKLQMSEFDSVTIVDVEKANRFLDSWIQATAPKTKQK